MWKYPTGIEVAARTDMSFTAVGITYAHDAVHRDVLVNASDYATGVSAARDYLITVPSTNDLHMVFLLSASVGATVQLYEAPVTTGAGTEIVTARLNRNSTKSTMAVVTVGPTITNVGTTLQLLYNGGGTSPNSGGGKAHVDVEWVMKAGVNYLVRVLPQATAVMSMEFEWYEVPAG